MYRVIEKFADLKDYNHIYEVGDIYPREGMLPLPERVAELSSNRNRLRTPLIEEIPEKPMKYEDTKVGKIESVEKEEPVEESKEEDKVTPKRRKKKAE
jgi:hypothetical protein